LIDTTAGRKHKEKWIKEGASIFAQPVYVSPTSPH